MRRITLTSGVGEAAAIAVAVDVLRAGGIVAFPTDTLYGLAVDPRRDDAVERLFALKGRRADAAVPLVAGDLEQAAAAGQFGAGEMRLATAFWPGPLSLVVPASSLISRGARAADGTVAIRVPAHPVACALALAFGFSITATSANASGNPPASSADAVAETLEHLDLLLDGGRAPGGLPSTIVSLQGNAPVLVRPGAVPWERVVKSLE